MSILYENDRLGDIVKSELDPEYSRSVVTVASGQDVALGAVLGKILFSAPATGTAGTNTGDGTCASVTAGKKAEVGTYSLTCLSVDGADSGWKVVTPSGVRLDDAAAGAAYESSQINFTITAGATAFVAGDVFTIAVAAGSGKVKAIDFDATDGSQIAYGIAYDDYDATSGDMDGVAIAREAVVIGDKLVWPDDAASDQKVAALAELAAKNIMSEEAV